MLTPLYSCPMVFFGFRSFSKERKPSSMMDVTRDVLFFNLLPSLLLGCDNGLCPYHLFGSRNKLCMELLAESDERFCSVYCIF